MVLLFELLLHLLRLMLLVFHVAKIGIILVMTKLWANVSQKLHESCAFTQ